MCVIAENAKSKCSYLVLYTTIYSIVVCNGFWDPTGGAYYTGLRTIFDKVRQVTIFT